MPSDANRIEKVTTMKIQCLALTISLSIFLIGCDLMQTLALPHTPVSVTQTTRPMTQTPPQPSVTSHPSQPTRLLTSTPLSPTPASSPGLICPSWNWGEADPLTFSAPGTLVEEELYQNYTVRVYKNETCLQGAFEILRGDQLLYARYTFRQVAVGYAYWDEKSVKRTIAMGQDITGDGIPNLVMSEHAGGAHCCYLIHVFQIGSTFRYLGAVGGDYAPRPIDLDDDGNWEFIVHDWTGRALSPGDWCESCAPAPFVILHYADEDYRVAVDLMRSPAPTTEEMAQSAQEIQKERQAIGKSTDVSYRFWNYSLELIYSGHAELVEPFWEMIWPDDPTTRDSRRSELLSTMSDSHYWPEIKALSLQWPWTEE